LRLLQVGMSAMEVEEALKRWRQVVVIYITPGCYSIHHVYVNKFLETQLPDYLADDNGWELSTLTGCRPKTCSLYVIVSNLIVNRGYISGLYLAMECAR
jgi:hypothetical protein